MRRYALVPIILSLALASSTLAVAQESLKPYPAQDVRFRPLKDLNGYFPFTPPQTKEDWTTRREAVRRQVLVAEGLWPLPTKTPLNAVIHGRVERDDFTVDRVFFESFPGHFVCGSLFKPKKIDGKHPVVLCPHGHWANGRFYDAGEAGVKKQIETGAEKYELSGRYPLQARCVQLARLGCIVFHYDMEGYADTVQIPFEVSHRYGDKRPAMESAETWGFFSPQAESRLQSIMGLQTWNSIRAIDFVTSLPEVDTTRIGVTGASGGGTQTMLIGAVDDRVTAIVPAVMVSTSMQGGCTCENCSLLRVGTGNVEFAALFAPKPQALLAADDWTKEIMTKGFPDLKKLYALLDAEDRVEAYPYVQFPHNYNYVSRAAMYGFFNKHFKLGAPTPIVEDDFKPLSREELTVWTGDHPQPPGGEEHERKLLRHMTEDADRQIAALTPTDAGSLAEYRKLVGGAVDVILGRRLDDVGEIDQENLLEAKQGDFMKYVCVLRDKAHGEEVVTSYFYPEKWNREVVVWLDERGMSGLVDEAGDPTPEVAKLVAAGYAVAGADLIGQGVHTSPEFPADRNRRVKNKRMFAGFTYGYDAPLLAQRVHDVLTVVAHARAHHDKPAKIHLVGLGDAGPIAAAAAAQCGGALGRVAVETGGFRFAGLTDYLDAAFLPGIVKYGDVPALLALAAPQELQVFGETKLPEAVAAAYRAAGAQPPTTAAKASAADVVAWLIGK